jgi:hypothetical protein
MHDMRKGAVLMIDYIQIRPKTSGFLVLVNHERPTPMEEFAYSDLDDLINGLIRLLGPIEPVVLGVDASSETVEEDDWCEWDGELRTGQEYPPSVKPTDVIQFKMRESSRNFGPGLANTLRWKWAGSNEPFYTPASDIIAYRIVRP